MYPPLSHSWPPGRFYLRSRDSGSGIERTLREDRTKDSMSHWTHDLLSFFIKDTTKSVLKLKFKRRDPSLKLYPNLSSRLRMSLPTLKEPPSTVRRITVSLLFSLTRSSLIVLSLMFPVPGTLPPLS